MSIVQYIPLLTQGAFITISAWAIAVIFSLIIGTLVGIISCRYYTTPLITKIVRTYTFVAKGIPAYIQILIAYFALPAIIGINIPGFVAAVGALIFCSSGYVVEIIRSGINTISSGQWDACKVLGYSDQSMLTRIILPQTFNNVLPSLFGEFEQLLKSTSLLATIGVTELTRSGMNIISRELNPIAIYMIIALIYLIFSALVQLIFINIEKRSYGYR